MDTGLHVHVYNKHPNYSRCNAGVDNSDAIAENCWKTATHADKQLNGMLPILSFKFHSVLQSLTGSISTKESPTCICKYNKHPNYSRCNTGVDNSDAIAENW